MKKITRLFLLLCLSVCMLSLTALAGEGEKFIIGFNSTGLKNQFIKTVEQSFQKAAEETGIIDVKIASHELDAQESLAGCDTLIEMGCQVIVDFSANLDVCLQVAEKCKEAGVPCIGVDAGLYGDYHYGVDDATIMIPGGTYVGELAKEKWDGKVDYFVYQWNSTSPATRDRCLGVLAGLEEVIGTEIPEENIFAQDNPDGDVVKSMQMAQDFLTAHPGVNVVFTCNCDDPMAKGIFSGIEASGRTDDVMLMGCDAAQVALDVFKQDEETPWVGSVCFFPADYGPKLVQMALDVLNGVEQEQYQWVPGEDVVIVGHHNVAEVFPDA